MSILSWFQHSRFWSQGLNNGTVYRHPLSLSPHSARDADEVWEALGLSLLNYLPETCFPTAAGLSLVHRFYQATVLFQNLVQSHVLSLAQRCTLTSQRAYPIYGGQELLGPHRNVGPVISAPIHSTGCSPPHSSGSC